MPSRASVFSKAVQHSPFHCWFLSGNEISFPGQLLDMLICAQAPCQLNHRSWRFSSQLWSTKCYTRWASALAYSHSTETRMEIRWHHEARMENRSLMKSEFLFSWINEKQLLIARAFPLMRKIYRQIQSASQYIQWGAIMYIIFWQHNNLINIIADCRPANGARRR